ncbi:DUF3800 domain-containing protein [Marmoricola sp. RAF53]|uniref:DUF3800 domain-containing protein n=1 Tax=Marmoricola sp. RAF53 TaxID=3233059 RepID=UPI003F9B6EDF
MSRFFAFVDETGDRGTAPNSSPVFGMAAVIMPEHAAPALREAVSRLRTDLAVPEDKVLSWKQYAKSHDRRRRAADVLGSVDGIHVCYVYAKKSALREGSYRDHNERFYNYVAFKTFKSIVWASRRLGATDVRIRFGHVKHHRHGTTEAYIKAQAALDPKVPDKLVGSMHWVSADEYVESQAADLFGGFLKAAVWPGPPFGYVEPSYLLSIWDKIHSSGTCAIPLGIMSMPSSDVLTDEEWFPCDHCTK